MKNVCQFDYKNLQEYDVDKFAFLDEYHTHLELAAIDTQLKMLKNNELFYSIRNEQSRAIEIKRLEKEREQLETEIEKNDSRTDYKAHIILTGKGKTVVKFCFTIDLDPFEVHFTEESWKLWTEYMSPLALHFWQEIIDLSCNLSGKKKRTVYAYRNTQFDKINDTFLEYVGRSPNGIEYFMRSEFSNLVKLSQLNHYCKKDKSVFYNEERQLVYFKKTVKTIPNYSLIRHYMLLTHYLLRQGMQKATLYLETLLIDYLTTKILKK
jgi:hypothetical protein